MLAYPPPEADSKVSAAMPVVGFADNIQSKTTVSEIRLNSDIVADTYICLFILF